MLILKRDGEEIATNIAIGVPYSEIRGLHFSAPQAGLSLTIEEQILADEEEPNPNWPIAGTYTFEAMPVPEVPELTPEQRREIMPDLSRLQFRLLLRSIGITEQNVADIIAGIADPEERYLVDLHWREASVYKRTHPLIAVAASLVGLTDEEIDEAWEDFTP